MAPLTIILRKKMFSKRSTFEIYTFETKFFDKKFTLKNLPYYLNYPNSRFNHKEIDHSFIKKRNNIIFNVLKQFYLFYFFVFWFENHFSAQQIFTVTRCFLIYWNVILVLHQRALSSLLWMLCLIFPWNFIYRFWLSHIV